MEKFESDVLGVHEKSEGYHDDYYIASISVAIDPNGSPATGTEKGAQDTMNGVDMASAKAVQDGKKIIAFRTEAAVTSIRKLLAEPAN